MGQPSFIQKIDGSGIGVHSLTLTPGAATTAGDMLLVGVVMTPTGAESPQSVAAIKDSAGDVMVGMVDTGVPINTWSGLGGNTDDGVHIEWWACRSIASITNLVISITGTGAGGAQNIFAVMLEYEAANGLTNPVFQPLQANQNTITTQDIVETVATFPNSGAELMIGLFAMLNDTFNGTPLEGTARSTNSLSIPPSLSYQVVEQGTVQPGDTNQVVTVSGEEITLVGGALNMTARSATQLATAGNVAASSMQCLYIVISGGLILNTQPGFSDQPDSVLAAGNFALGLQLAKINGNAALGMCRMEFFQGVYTNGQTVDLPVSSVDGYQYSIAECTFLWQVFNSANASTGWITGPTSLWFCGWNVDQDTAFVTCDEWYRNAADSAESQDGSLQVFIVAQRQQQTLTAATQPTWTQQNASLFTQDLAYSSDVLIALNESAKFAVLAQEVISMGEFYNGQTVPRPVSPADGYEYAYSGEVTFVYCWRWTTGQAAYAAPAWEPYEGLGALYASIAASTGVVTCGIGWSEHDGNNYAFDSTYGRVAVFAFCQRARTGTPSEIGDKFAEIPNTLFYPGNDAPAGIGAQLCRNINEAACSPEFFGPTNYLPGDTIPVPTSPIDSYVYQRPELTYLWQWHVMDTGVNDDPRTYGSGTHVRTPLFSASIDQSTGLVSTEIWHLAPGGPYTEYTTTGILSVVVVGFRTSQQTEVSGTAVQAPSDAGSSVTDQLSAGNLSVNGV